MIVVLTDWSQKYIKKFNTFKIVIAITNKPENNTFNIFFFIESICYSPFMNSSNAHFHAIFCRLIFILYIQFNMLRQLMAITHNL